MKRSKFSSQKIVQILKEFADGTPVDNPVGDY